jgi:hypothetical protein
MLSLQRTQRAGDQALQLMVPNDLYETPPLAGTSLNPQYVFG